MEEVLILCKNKIFINIELKDSNVNDTFNQVIKLIEEKEMINQIAISSFNYNYYDLILKYNWIWKNIWHFFFPFFKKYHFELKNICFNIYHKDITKEIVDKAHENGNGVMAWFKMKDVENDDVYKRLFDCGINVICCNEPNKAKEYRDNKYYNHK